MSESGKDMPVLELPVQGRIPYGERGALQDAALAMGKDVVRGLVEAITNASDSYGRLERRGIDAGDGRIDVLVERRREGMSRIVVRDHAEGLLGQDILYRVLQSGERRSESGDRGFMGRGAKDAAYFGGTTFESIKDGMFATAHVTPGLNWEGLRTRVAEPLDYGRLGLPAGSNGTQVTILVDRSHFSIPRHDGLVRRLSRNVQLRNIVTSARRKLTLADLNRPDRSATTVTFTFPVVWTELDRVLLQIPDYPGANTELEIRRCIEPLEDDRGPERISGFVVEDGTAVHESTYFGMEGRSGALRFAGVLRCPYIRVLQEAYDDPHSTLGDGNPIPIVTRSRAGLNREHPFVEQLWVAVENHLRPLVEQEEEAQADQGGQETADTRNRLKQAARELGRRFLEEARKLEVEFKDRGAEDGMPGEPVALRVIPPRAFLQPDATATFTVQSWPEAFADQAQPDPWVATLRIDDQEVATISTHELVLEPDSRDPRRRRGTFEVMAGAREDATLVEVRLGDVAEAVIVEVAASPEQPALEPTRLMFAQTAYRVRPNRPKSLVLMAPRDLIASAGATVTLTTTHDDITVPLTLSLQFREAGDGRAWHEGELEVTVPAGVHGRVRASLGNQAAACTVNSSEHEGHNPFDFVIVDQEPRYDSQGRADWIHPKGVRTLQIFAGHRSLRPYFGDRMERQSDLPCRLLIAEILASELALLTLTEADRIAGSGITRDAHTYTARLKELATAYLPTAHAALVPEFAGRR